MKMFKKAVALVALVAMCGSSAAVSANDCRSTGGGCGYEECRRAPCIGPALALGTIALIAVIAVALQNQSHSGHGHCHR